MPSMVTVMSHCSNCAQLLGCSLCFSEKSSKSINNTFSGTDASRFSQVSGSQKTYYPTDKDFIETEPGSGALVSENAAELVKEVSLWFLGMIVTVAQIQFPVCMKFCWMLRAEGFFLLLFFYLSCKNFSEDIGKYLFLYYFSFKKTVLLNDSLSWTIYHSFTVLEAICW